MANRDVQLVIRARNEADRAIESISSALRALVGAQNDVTGSGERTSTTLEQLAGAFKTMDAAIGKIEQAVGSAKTSLDAQTASLAENEARYGSLTREIHAAEQAILNTRIAMQNDGSAQLAARLGAAQASYRTLISEAGRLKGTIAGQRAEVGSAGEAYQGLEGAATAAQIAVGKFGQTGEREALQVAAASRQATAQLLEQAAAARQEAAARNAQGAFNAQLGVRDIPAGAARSSAAVFEAEAKAKEADAAASRELDAAAQQLRDRLNPEAAAQAKMNAEIAAAKELYQTGRIRLREYVAEIQRLEAAQKRVLAQQARNGSSEVKGVLGLRPYEMQNLSYQINDVISGLASGQPVSQIFAQQFGQIVQLFPKVLTGLLKYWRGLGLVAVALAPVIIGLHRLNEVMELQRGFAANLALSGDSAKYNSSALVDNVKALDEYGASLADATAAVKEFVSEGINPDVMNQMGEATQNLAKITGEKLTDAAKDVATAFSGGYDALAKFDDQMNFLTASEREQIRAMFESGDASDARALAFQRFYDQAAQGASDLESSWDRMTRTMSAAWSDFENFVADTSFLKGLRADLNSAMVGATYLLDRMRGLRHEEAARAALGLAKPGDPGGPPASPHADPLAADSKRRAKARADALAEIAEDRKVASAKGEAGKEAAAGEKAYADEMRKSGDAVVAAAKRDLAIDQARAHAPKGRHGKTLADYQRDYNHEIEVENKEREITAENTNKTNVLEGQALILEQRRQAIAEAVRKAEEKATKNTGRKLSLSQAQRSEIERTTALEFDAAHAKAMIQADEQEHERVVNDLLERRKTLLAQIEFTSPGGDDYNRLQAAVLGVNLQLEQASNGMVDFWKSVEGDPGKLAMLGKTHEEVDAIIADLGNQTHQIQRDALAAAQKQAEFGIDDLQHMQDLLQQQIEFAQKQGESGKAGKLEQQLAAVNDKLATGAQRAIDFWTGIRGNPEDLAIMGLTPAAVDNIILGLENTKTAAAQLRTQFLETGQAINQDLAQGGASAMEQFAQSIVQGQNVLESFGMAFAKMAADFLLKIAEMIAQQAIFNALSGGSPGGAGGVGGGIAGLIGHLFHGGGVVSGGGRSRAVAAGIFANATRYHSGGVAGLRPDEVPAILQRGEEVLTAADARHRRNGGGGKAGRGLAQILAIGDKQIAGAMAGAAGRDVVLTHISTERVSIRQALGIDG